MPAFKAVKGFRDLTPELCSRRNYLFAIWREVARRYGFVEWEGPILESVDLYRKKSGDEIVSQLFWFTDKGEREVAMRPELTPTLARLAVERQRDYRKPLKWFQIGPCFRYEEPQRGRTREFNQWNVDLLGDASQGADAEVLAMAADTMRELGLGPEDVTLRVSDRRAWLDFARENGVGEEQIPGFLQIIDKLERTSETVIRQKLSELGAPSLTFEGIKTFIAEGSKLPVFQPILENLEARGLKEYVTIDLGIVRGLAYYTGLVFEVFDLKHHLRAVAGGGRYDNLCQLMSDGSLDLPAVGLGMGDVVLGELVQISPVAKSRFEAWQKKQLSLDVFVVIADEAARASAIRGVQHLRNAGLRVDYSLVQTKMNKQFQAAEHAQARFAVIYGAELPEISLKDLLSRRQWAAHQDELVREIQWALEKEEEGPLIADQS